MTDNHSALVKEEDPLKQKTGGMSMKKTLIMVVLIGIVLFVAVKSCLLTVPAGYVGVATLFGKVKQDVYSEGLHFVNPLLNFWWFDGRQKTHKESMAVPSKDQLLTKFEISIQYRLIKEKAPSMLKETGTPEEVIEVHMIPLLRSQMREIGKSVGTAEMFYDQEVQQRIQMELLNGMRLLAEKGIKIDKLLIRDVVLPKIITDAVVRKKEAAQAAEKAKEELKKFKVDQERKEAQAEAEKRAQIIEANKSREVMLIGANARLDAARIDAQALLVSAEAEAESKRKVIDAVGIDGYIKLESMKALVQMQNGNHMFIIDPNAASPLPFLNLTNGMNPK